MSSHKSIKGSVPALAIRFLKPTLLVGRASSLRTANGRLNQNYRVAQYERWALFSL